MSLIEDEKGRKLASLHEKFSNLKKSQEKLQEKVEEHVKTMDKGPISDKDWSRMTLTNQLLWVWMIEQDKILNKSER